MEVNGAGATTPEEGVLRDLLTVLVTGSRDWIDTAIIKKALHQVQEDYPSYGYLLIHGCAEGADSMTATAAEAMGWGMKEFPVTASEWVLHGKIAGHLRNQRMVDQDPDLCLAFVMPCNKIGCTQMQAHISHGTDDCMRRARLAGVPVREYPHDTVVLF
jgi:hypothetical protein